ncbi:ATP-binding protein, partial [Enterovirga sp.]|uniref:ATP-binding protein n=1 Tax=Enterovirga sp. TaxID=2026350 RepID=UPI002BB95BF7|nr:hypothetical protein [Enterovirga sp.]
SVTGIATEREAAGIRRRREEAWAAHRRALDPASADAFEEAMRHDDIVGAGRLSGMADLAKLHQNGQALAVARADLARAAELEEGAAAALARLDAEVAQAIRAMVPGIDPIPSLPGLEDWLARRDRALEAREAVRRAERDLRAAQADAGAARDRLRAALGRIGHGAPEAGFEAWLAEAQAVLDREAELRHLRSDLETRRRDLAGRESAAAVAEAAERSWTEAWEAACRGCWLGEAAELPPVGTVGEILAATGELAGALDKRDGLLDRIGKMEKDQGAFREEVAALADAFGVPFDPARVLDAAQLVGDRIREAEAASDSRKRVLGQLEEARERRRRLAERSEIHAQGRQKICAFFGVASLEQVARKLADAARRAELRGQAEEAGREILEATRAPDLAAAEAMLAAVDREALEAELIERKARRDDQDRRCHELFAAWSAARDKVEAIGGDAVAAAIEERRRTVLLEIEDGAMRYLQLRAGIAATERALAAYRERHRSSMMTRASAAFRAITCGAYDGLAAQPGKEGETLIALPAGGGSKAAAELSKGTRFQLYLALRVAGYHEFLRARRAVPFVADDIMETFDDHRAEESFRLLGEMAEGGQVIYLTHHRHLCEIARRACPAARLHSLDEAPASP